MRGCWHLRFTQQLQEAQEAPKGKRRARRSLRMWFTKICTISSSLWNENMGESKKKGARKSAFLLLEVWTPGKAISRECRIYPFTSERISFTRSAIIWKKQLFFYTQKNTVYTAASSVHYCKMISSFRRVLTLCLQTKMTRRMEIRGSVSPINPF